MKKTIAIALASIMMLLSGCGNDWHLKFNKAHIKIDGKWQEVEVKRWHDYDYSDMVAIETDKQVFVTHSMNVVFIKDK